MQREGKAREGAGRQTAPERESKKPGKELRFETWSWVQLHNTKALQIKKKGGNHVHAVSECSENKLTNKNKQQKHWPFLLL